MSDLTKFYYKRIDLETGECTGFLVSLYQRNEPQFEPIIVREDMRDLMRLAYKYAEIIISTGECIGVVTSSYELTGEEYILIPTYNEDYLGIYYIDAEGTIPYEG